MNDWLTNCEVQSLTGYDKETVRYYRLIGVLEFQKDVRGVERVTKLGKLITYYKPLYVYSPESVQKLKERLKK